MNLNQLISLDFVWRHSPLSWREALWGYERQMLGWRDLVELAQKKLARGSSNATEIELAKVQKSDSWQAKELAMSLAENEPCNSESLMQRKWLFLKLFWLYEHRLHLDDPLGEVERVYADFNYPAEMESFVRYMPPSDGYDPLLHTKLENEERVYRRWDQYIRSAQLEFGWKSAEAVGIC